MSRIRAVGRGSRGFTVLEFLFVATITALLVAAILVNRQSSSESQALARSANLVAVDLRRAQTFAFAAPTVGATVQGGFGILFSGTSPSYTIFSDTNGNLAYDAPSGGCGQGECLEQRTLGGRVSVSALDAGSSQTGAQVSTATLTVIFCPPYGDVFIFDALTPVSDRGTNCTGNKNVAREYATVFLSSSLAASAPGILRNIRIYASGGVDLLDNASATAPPDITYTPSASTLPPPPPPSTSGFVAHINFQPLNSQLYTGYTPDYGDRFDLRNGLQYGWTCATSGNEATTVDRNSTLSPDQRYDTFARLDDTGGCLGAKWELKVSQDGVYNVTLVSGDPDPVEGPASHYVLLVEGQPAMDFQGTLAQPWTAVTVPVNMTAADHRITVESGAGAQFNKINFIIIRKLYEQTPPPPPPEPDTIVPLVSITFPANNSRVTPRTRITITADASDNVGVARVEFYVGGALLCTSTNSSYGCVWQVPGAHRRTYSIEARAYDQAGNVGRDSISVTSSSM